MNRWLVWNVLFRIHELAKGHATYRVLRELEDAERLSAGELEKLCAAKLQELLGYCYAHVPYVRTRMREAGIQPSQIRGPQDLARLPLMTKADVRQHRASLHSDLNVSLVPFSTGGSTGEPLIFDLARRRIAARVACRQRASRWWDLSVGDREFVFWGSPVELTRQDWLRNLRDRLLRTQLLSAFEMSEPMMSRFLDLITAKGCRQIFGYPSSIYLLCLYANKCGRNLRGLGIKAVFVTGEVLLPYQRELITETMNCPVANGYGGRDSGFVAHECPQGGMHLMVDAVITEVVDPEGRPLPPGEAGEIVITDLYSHEMPFLRYATGDIGVLSSRRCSCGLVLPLLERIEGRSTDFILTPDGRTLHALSLIYILREIEGVEQFRITQEKVDCFYVQVVRNANYRMESESRICDGLSRRLRAPVQVSFDYPASLPAEGSGKFRHVVCKIPIEGLQRREQDIPIVSASSVDR